MIVLTLTALLTIVPLFPILAIPAGIAIVVLTILAWRRHDQAGTSLGLFAAACVVLSAAGVSPQQVLFPIAFTAYFVVVWRVPWPRRASAWLKRGALDGAALALAAGIAAVSAVALLAWYGIFKPDLADLVRTFVPNRTLGTVAPGAVVFAMLNAAIEEAAYRGILLSALDAALGRGPVPVLLQAVAFGALHLYGQYVTHDQLLAAVFRGYPNQRQRINAILGTYDWRRVRADVMQELASLCSPRRTTLILTCLRRRLRAIRRALDGTLPKPKAYTRSRKL